MFSFLPELRFFLLLSYLSKMMTKTKRVIKKNPNFKIIIYLTGVN